MVAELKKPRFDLAKAQQAAVIVSSSCAARACVLLPSDDVAAARKHIEKLFRSLRPEDFAYQQAMPQKTGKPRYGDVYGKRDRYGVWFIKFEVQGDVTVVVMSCHEVEEPLKLVDGRTLRKKT